MIEEAYVSFETAKLLKEKGFDERTIYGYIRSGNIVTDCCYCNIPGFPNDYGYNNTKVTGHYVCAKPTLQMAMKWLRIEHNIHIEPHIVRTKCSYGYMPNYIDLKELKQHFPFDEFDFSNADKYACITYDKACEVTIKYCLENMI